MKFLIGFLVGLLTVGLGAQDWGGFQLTSKLEFAGFSGGREMYMMGKGLILMPMDPVIRRQMKPLEDKQVTIILRREP